MASEMNQGTQGFFPSCWGRLKAELLEGLSVHLNDMLDLDSIARLRQHIRNLQHAGRAARGDDLTPRLHNVVALALADGCGNVIMLQIETPPAYHSSDRLRPSP